LGALVCVAAAPGRESIRPRLPCSGLALRLDAMLQLIEAARLARPLVKLTLTEFVQELSLGQDGFGDSCHLLRCGDKGSHTPAYRLGAFVKHSETHPVYLSEIHTIAATHGLQESGLSLDSPTILVYEVQRQADTE